MASSQEIVRAKESVFPSPFTCLEACGSNIVWTEALNAEERHPVEKLGREGNWRAWEKDNTVAAFSTCLQ